MGHESFFNGTRVGICNWDLAGAEAGSETRKKLMTRGADLAQRLGNKGEAKLADDGEAQQEQTKEAAPNAQMQSGNNQAGINQATDQGSNNQETQSTQDPVAEVLNSASKTKLRSVPGIGDATARRIIESRPFESEAEVVESKVMPEKVLKTLKDKLVDVDEEVA